MSTRTPQPRRTLYRFATLTIVLLATLAFLAPGASAQTKPDSPASVSQAQVETAIRNGVEFLYAKRKNGIHWEEEPNPPAQFEDNNDRVTGQWGGKTAMAVYALLACGEDPQGERLKPSIEPMLNANLQGVYAISMRLLACTYLPLDEQVRATITRDAQALLNAVETKDMGAGHFDYLVDPTAQRRRGPVNYSHSRSQYGLLGIWAAWSVGYDVPIRFWALCDNGWRRNQRADGGWGYMDIDTDRWPTTPGMTAAGLASLFITGAQASTMQAECRGNWGDERLDGGLAWLAANMDKVATNETYQRDFPLATLYAVERVGVASGLRFIGGVDWFDKGAAWLIDNQRRDGSFGRSDWGNEEGTAFGLLFLARGRSPVAVQKLAYTQPGRGDARTQGLWNQRPRDVANAVDFTGRGMERELHWQILPEDRPVDEWLSAPVLVISGGGVFNPDEKTRQTIRDYVTRGGLVVANADCGNRQFRDSAIKVLTEILGDIGGEFRVVEDDNAIWRQQFNFANVRRKPRVLGMTNGVRELAIVTDGTDLGRDWQTQTRAPSAQTEGSFQLGTNLILYAAGGRDGLRPKGASIATKNENLPAERTVVVGRLKYEGRWNPEPAAWSTAEIALHNNLRTDIDVRDVEATELEGVDLLHLTGARTVQLNDEAKAAIVAWVDAGGTLLVDAAGGSTEFAGSAEALLSEMFADDAANLRDPLPVDHALFTAAGWAPAVKADEIEWRSSVLERLGAVRGARLRGIERDGRLAVLYSSEDLVASLAGVKTASVVGYEPATATALAARILQLAKK